MENNKEYLNGALLSKCTLDVHRMDCTYAIKKKLKYVYTGIYFFGYENLTLEYYIQKKPPDIQSSPQNDKQVSDYMGEGESQNIKVKFISDTNTILRCCSLRKF